MRFIPEPGVEILDVLNHFETGAEGGYALPDLVSGEPLDIVVRVKLPGGVPGRARAFRITLFWTRQGETIQHSMDVGALANYAAKDKAGASPVDPEVSRTVELLEAARAKQKAVAQLDYGDHRGVSHTLRTFASTLQLKSEEMLDMEMAKESKEMADLADSLDDIHQRAISRKSMKYSSSYRRKGKKVKE